MNYKKIIGCTFLSLLTLAGKSNAVESFKWPGGAKAAVSLAYDDALNSHLDNAIPALDKYGLKGSFYVYPASGVLFNRVDEWRSAAKNGHELGNHSLFHECDGSLPNREWQKPYHDLSKKSVEQVREQILLVNGFLKTVDGKTERTYTAPCGDLMAAGENYIDAIKGDFVAAKTVFGGITPDMSKLDYYRVGVDGPVGSTGEQLIATVKRAAAQGTMANLTFHGIGGDHLSVSKEAHEELLKYLADNKDIYWTDSFINIMKYVKEQQKAK